MKKKVAYGLHKDYSMFLREGFFEGPTMMKGRKEYNG